MIKTRDIARQEFRGRELVAHRKWHRGVEVWRVYERTEGGVYALTWGKTPEAAFDLWHAQNRIWGRYEWPAGGQSR